MNHSEPVRLVRVVTRLNVGGPARHVTILSTRMGPDFNGTLLVGEPGEREGSLLDEAIQAGATIRHVPGLRRQIAPLDDLRALVWLYRYFRRVRPEIVATHTAKAGLLGRIAATLAGVPIRVHTFHGHVLQGYFSPAVTRVFRSLEQALSRVTTRFIAVSPAIANDLLKMGIGRNKLSVIRNGLDLESFKTAEAGQLHRDLGLPEHHRLVGIVGRLAPVKNHRLFLEAARVIGQRKPDARFVIVGDGEMRAELQAQTLQLGLRDRVFFTGWRRSLPEVYGDLDIVVCCSLNEGTPTSVIEAGAAARPVVVTAVGGMTDIVQDGVNGIVVQSGDVTSLAGAIEKLLDDQALAGKLGQSGRQLAFANHGSQRMADEVKSLYLRILESKGLQRAVNGN